MHNNSIQDYLHSAFCEAALQEIKFLYYIYILQKLNIFNLWQHLFNSVYFWRVGIISSQVFGHLRSFKELYNFTIIYENMQKI